MFAINLITIFVFGLVVTAIVLKGMMQAEEFAKIEKQYGLENAPNETNPKISEKDVSSGEMPVDTY